MVNRRVVRPKPFLYFAEGLLYYDTADGYPTLATLNESTIFFQWDLIRGVWRIFQWRRIRIFQFSMAKFVGGKLVAVVGVECCLWFPLLSPFAVIFEFEFYHYPFGKSFMDQFHTLFHEMGGGGAVSRSQTSPHSQSSQWTPPPPSWTMNDRKNTNQVDVPCSHS